MKKLPLGIQNFREIIEGGYIYADKTRYIYSLLEDGKYYFLSRPRRFGKSLLLDTIKELFSGDKELFRGLWIYGTGYGFKKHPVIRLDMSNIASDTPEMLKDLLSKALLKQVKKENLDIGFDVPSEMFKNLIEELADKYNQRVVVLIDEYDKPILDHIADPEAAEANRKALRGFYGILKSMDPHLEAVFITGVTKFTKTSIFSELNNLMDITLTREYAGICGIAVEDLEGYFGEHIDDLLSIEGFGSRESALGEILAWYDGYSWDGRGRVINPFSLLSFFRQKRLSGYWYASGTPSFLVGLIKKRPESFLELRGLEMRERALDSFDLRKIGVASLLFQTGYLTVKETRYHKGPESYLLGIPNLEVREALNMNIIAEFTEKGEDYAEAAYWRIKESLEAGDLEGMLKVMRALFSSIPYQLHIDREAYYHSIFYAVMNVLGFDTDVEAATAKGRIDAALELEGAVFVMEFKYVKCDPGAAPEAKGKLAEKALSDGMKQIKDRGYAKKYMGSGKKIILAAFAFLGRDDIEMRVCRLGERQEC